MSELDLKKQSKVRARSVVPDERTGEETASILQVSVVFLESLIKKGRLTGARSVEGGRYRIPRASVLSLKNEMKLEQKEGLDQTVSASEKIGLYDAELEDIRICHRRST
ncbi:excisionase family DNA binding protein [Paraburkholderia fungorum]|jgi:excisionase family DNA binding protein|uniref:helix-turn-helix domain-containing protein n=1 Tax=Paraburkholderia fungorum TaxID=134537 RepID=UPI000D06EB3B|nr:helix-turn-helix domain-containing protein [Paraburkholderia fungorum]PRZ55827.1 excisionase family DNA binding protein [Paraburkholderia fungorum]